MAAKPKVPAPTTRAEADAMLRAIGNLAGELRRLAAKRDAKVAEIAERYAPRIAELEEQHKAAVRALEKWAERYRALLIGDDRRSHDLSAGTIGWRRTPPAVKVRAEDLEAVLAELQRLDLSELVRPGKPSLDRDAVLKAPEKIEAVAGITVESGQIFWMRPEGVPVEIKATKRAIEIVPLDVVTTPDAAP